jgi:hypothetical protein
MIKELTICKRNKKGMGYGSVVENLPGMYEALGSILSKKKKKKKKKNEEEEDKEEENEEEKR